jgi:hypothetical protein
MRNPRAKREIVPADFDRTENYYMKRFGAYFIDLMIVLLVLMVPFFLLGADVSDPVMVALFILCLGIGTIAYKTAFEYYRDETPGKNLLGLKVERLGDVDAERELQPYLLRNMSALLPVVFPAIDLAYGYANSQDNRMKYLDENNGMIVVEVMPVVVKEIPRRPMKVEPRQEPQKMHLGFDQGYARGTCPRCGAPYRVLPPGNTGFSGLWNHRCTWCNSLIQESLF